MQGEKQRELAYKKYLSHFCKLHDVDKIGEEYERAYLYMKDKIQIYLPKDPNANILDLGSGLGHSLYAFKKLGYKNVTGIEISSDCARFCKEKGFEVEEKSILDFLKNPAEKFHVIYGCDVIEHFHKQEATKLVSMAKNSLKNHGLLILILPNANNLSNFRLRYMDTTHEVFYTPESISQLLSCGGFEICKIVGLPHFTPNDMRKRRMLFKSFVGLPTHEFSKFLHKMFYLSVGLTDVKIVEPRLLAIGVKN